VTTTNPAQSAAATVDASRSAISIPKYCDASIASYEYGARLDEECLALAWDQIAKARELYNKVVERIREIVGEMQAYVIAQGGPAAAELQSQIDACNRRFGMAKTCNDDRALREIALERRGRWKDFARLLASVRKDHMEILKSRFYARIGRNAGTDTYRLRAEAVAQGLGWATANAVLDNALRAYSESIAKGRPPRFSIGADKTHDTLTLQFTAAGGVSAADILSGRHSEIALVPTDGVGRRKYGQLRFRLGPAVARTDATGTFQYHRPLPEAAHVALARLVRRRIGFDAGWTIQLLVKRPPATMVVPGARKPLAAVHFGWATDTSGRKVAGLATGADPGCARLVQLPPSVEEDLQRASALQAARDAARDQLVVRLKDLTCGAVPEVAQAEFLALVALPAQQVSQRRLAAFCAKWESAPAESPDWLRQWRREDRLRWQASTHIARRARMRRRDFYRVLAAELANSYEVVAIEPLDLAATAKKIDESTGERGAFGAKARAGQNVAAVSELESAVRWACAKAGSVVLDVIAPTASTCSICGGALSDETDRPDQSAVQTIACPHCGARIDRKCNGAAVAWQIVWSERDAWIERYHLEAAQAMASREVNAVARKTKMAAARNAKRQALQEASIAAKETQAGEKAPTCRTGR